MGNYDERKRGRRRNEVKKRLKKKGIEDGEGLMEMSKQRRESEKQKKNK